MPSMRPMVAGKANYRQQAGLAQINGALDRRAHFDYPAPASYPAAATASSSISQSGLARALTTTRVEAGWAPASMRSRIWR